MQKINNFKSGLTSSIKKNAVEIWATLSIFVGLPIVAWLYLDYKAAILVFVLASSILGTLAVRNK